MGQDRTGPDWTGRERTGQAVPCHDVTCLSGYGYICKSLQGELVISCLQYLTLQLLFDHRLIS